MEGVTITINWQSIITAGAVLGALGTIIALIVKAVRWFDRQKAQDADIEKNKTQHDADIKALHDKHDADMKELREELNKQFDEQKEEMQLIICGVLASLQGLSEQGCNGPVTATIKQFETYLNEKAHQRGGI